MKFQNMNTMNTGGNENEFEKIVAKDFNGDFDKAVEYVLASKDFQTLTRYVLGLTPKQKTRFTEGFKKYMNKHYPGGYKTAVLEGNVAPKLRINTETLRNMKNNPYKAHIARALLADVLAFAGVFGVSMLAKNPEVSSSLISFLGMGGAVLTGSFSVDFGFNMLRYHDFNKLQKIYSTPEYREQYEKYLQNKDHLDSLVRFVVSPTERKR